MAATRTFYRVRTTTARTLPLTRPALERLRHLGDKSLKTAGYSPASVTAAIRQADMDDESARDAHRTRPEMEALAAFLGGYGD